MNEDTNVIPFYASKEEEQEALAKFESNADEEKESFGQQFEEDQAEIEQAKATALLMEQRIAEKKLRVFKNISKAYNISLAKVLYGYINQLPESDTLFKDDGVGCYWFLPRHEKLWKSVSLNRFQYWDVVNKLIKAGFIFKTKIKGVANNKELYTVNFVMMDTFEDERFKPEYRAKLDEELKSMEQMI